MKIYLTTKIIETKYIQANFVSPFDDDHDLVVRVYPIHQVHSHKPMIIRINCHYSFLVYNKSNNKSIYIIENFTF